MKLLGWILPLLLFSLTAGANTQDMDKVEYAADTVPVTLSVTLSWYSCGQPNAWTFPHGTILLCDELLQIGVGYARFTVLHELGHEAVSEYAIPVTGSEEAAADDFAVVMSVMEGNPEDVLEVVNTFDAWGTFMPRDKDDPHPSYGDRAIRMRQLLRGMLGEEAFKREWARAVRSWYDLTRPERRVGVH